LTQFCNKFGLATAQFQKHFVSAFYQLREYAFWSGHKFIKAYLVSVEEQKTATVAGKDYFAASWMHSSKMSSAIGKRRTQWTLGFGG
jgi:hypothetical protein